MNAMRRRLCHIGGTAMRRGVRAAAMLLCLGLLPGSCQKLDLYVEYPYRLVSGNPVAASPLQTLTLSTIVGRHT